MIIKQKNDIEPKNNSIGIIYGLAGVGKTTFCGKGDTLLFDLEEGVLRSSADCSIAQGVTLKDILDMIKSSEYKNIAIDTGDELVRLISADCKSENPKLQSASQTLRLYGAVLDKLIYFIGEVRKSGKNVVFVCHGKKDESTDTQRFIPRFGSENNNIELFKVCDFIGYLYAQGTDRYLTFDPSDFNNCKNSLQIQTRKISKNDNVFEILSEARENLILDFESKKSKIKDFIISIKSCQTEEELDQIGLKLRENKIFDKEIVKLFSEIKKNLSNEKN